MTSRWETSSCFNILNCVFYSCTYISGNGGGISINPSSGYQSIIGTSFISCTCGNNNGGAFYDYGGLYFEINRVCIFNCSGKSGSSFYIDLYYGTTDTSKINQSSVQSCSNYKDNAGSHIMRVMYGRFSFDSMNMTMNSINGAVSGISFYNVVRSRIDHSSFGKNNGNTVVFFEIGNDNEISESNFYDNHKCVTSLGVVSSDKTFTIRKCSFKANNNIIGSGTIVFDSCSFDNFAYSGSVTTLNCNSFPTWIQHYVFYSHYCSNRQQNTIQHRQLSKFIVHLCTFILN